MKFGDSMKKLPTSNNAFFFGGLHVDWRLRRKKPQFFFEPTSKDKWERQQLNELNCEARLLKFEPNRRILIAKHKKESSFDRGKSRPRFQNKRDFTFLNFPPREVHLFLVSNDVV